MVVVSGAPGRKDREKDPLLHHKVKTFETQRRVYDEVTAASKRVGAIKRPVYIEVPHDMVGRAIPTAVATHPVSGESDPDALAAALAETLSLIRAAKKPVILAGVELSARYRMAHLVVRMAERFNIPIAADLLSKSAVPENHPLYPGCMAAR